jgi:hypothetical protein
MPGVEIVDVNDIATFPDAAFHDGWHLLPDWAAYYRTVLSSQGLMRFARRLPPLRLPEWHGETISFAASSTPGPVRVAGLHAAEPWGRWTDGTKAEIVLNLAPDAARGRTLVLRATALVRKGPQHVQVKIDDRVLCGRDLARSGDVAIECPLPGELRGPLVLVVETSYATAPSEFGEADGRSLGIGLHSLSLR